MLELVEARLRVKDLRRELEQRREEISSLQRAILDDEGAAQRADEVRARELRVRPALEGEYQRWKHIQAGLPLPRR